MKPVEHISGTRTCVQPNCRHPNRPLARFCAQCGSPLAADAWAGRQSPGRGGTWIGVVLVIAAILSFMWGSITPVIVGVIVVFLGSAFRRPASGGRRHLPP